VTEKKNKTKSFGGQVLGDPWSTKTKPVLVKPKVVTKTCFITETNPFPTFDLIIQIKMGSMFPPAASSSLPLPICSCHACCGGSGSGSGSCDGGDDDNGDDGSGDNGGGRGNGGLWRWRQF
jgi:hypothetical protein